MALSPCKDHPSFHPCSSNRFGWDLWGSLSHPTASLASAQAISSSTGTHRPSVRETLLASRSHVVLSLWSPHLSTATSLDFWLHPAVQGTVLLPGQGLSPLAQLPSPWTSPPSLIHHAGLLGPRSARQPQPCAKDHTLFSLGAQVPPHGKDLQPSLLLPFLLLLLRYCDSVSGLKPTQEQLATRAPICPALIRQQLPVQPVPDSPSWNIFCCTEVP